MTDSGMIFGGKGLDICRRFAEGSLYQHLTQNHPGGLAQVILHKALCNNDFHFTATGAMEALWLFPYQRHPLLQAVDPCL